MRRSNNGLRCARCVVMLVAGVGLLRPAASLAQATDGLSSLQTECELPAIASDAGAALSLGKLAAADFASCTLSLRNPETKDANAMAYALERDAVKQGWQAIAVRKATRTPVATFTVEQDALTFRWLPGVTRAAASGLRNSLLEVKLGGKSKVIHLRLPIRDAASALDLRKDLTTISVAPVDLPDDGALKFELKELAGYFNPLTYEPASKRVGFKQPLKIIVKKPDANSPGIELHVMLMKNATKVNVNLRPVMVAEGGATIPFTTKRLTDVTNSLNHDLATAQNAKRTDENRVIRLQEDLAGLSVVVGTAQDIAIARQQRLAIQQRIATLEVEIAQLEKGIGTLEKRIKALPSLNEVGTALHDKAALNFRVYYEAGGKEIDLFTAEKKK